MSRPRSFRTEGVVIRSTPLMEAGLMVTLFTREWGKLRVVVHGARKPSSKLVGHLEVLNCVDLTLHRARPGNLDIVSQAQIVEAFPALRTELEGATGGMYMTEVVDGFGAEGSPNQEMYQLLVGCLRALHGGAPRDHVLRYFEMQVLDHSGFMPELQLCVDCREALEPGQHLYSPEAGGTLCPSCGRKGQQVYQMSVNALKALRYFRRSSLEQACSLRLEPQLTRELTTLLSGTLKYWLDREIRSRTFLDRLA